MPAPRASRRCGAIPWLTSAADELASALPDTRRESLPGQQHNVEAGAIAPALAEFFDGVVQALSAPRRRAT